MKIKALKDFQSSIISMDAGDVKEVDLDEYTFKNWSENGLIEEVKTGGKKLVKTDETQ